MTQTPGATTKVIVVDQVLPHSREKIWRALTDPALIGEWLMACDGFAPVVGQHFTLRAKPMGDWNGIVECEVLEVKPPERLRYSWRGGSSTSAAVSALNSVVTWTLTEVDGGTRVRMQQDGFRPENEMGFQAMSHGWPGIVQRLGNTAGML